MEVSALTSTNLKILLKEHTDGALVFWSHAKKTCSPVEVGGGGFS